MSLIAWYPLLENGNNQGLDDTNLEVMGTVPYNTGKIGNAATFSGVAANCLHRPSFNLTDNFTWACWVKITNTVSTYQFILSEGRDYEKYGMSLIVFTNGSIGLMYGTNSTLVILSSPVLNTWYHITVVVSSTEGIKGYVDGALAVTGPYKAPDYTYNSNRFTIGKMSYAYTNTANYFPLNGQVNDVRIYNHALSVKEIKEISKGLILHYPLDNNGMGNKNMVIGTDENTNWAWTMQTGGYTRTYEEADGGTWCCLTRDSVAQSGWSVIYYNNEISRSEIEPNSTYTISFEILPSHNFRLGLSIMNVNGTNVLTNGTGYQDLQANVINKVAITVTTLSTLPSSTEQRLYITGMNNAAGASYKFRKVKMEKGDKATTWCPNPSDALYTFWNIDSNNIPDCSGYKHNGTANELLSSNIDSPRHEISTHIEGTNQINLFNLPYESIDNGTLSFWIKINKFKGWSHYVFIANSFNWTGNGNDFIIVANRQETTEIETAEVILDCCSYTSAHFMTINQWYHITFTWDAKNYIIKKYINGNCVKIHEDSDNKRLNTYRSKHGVHRIGAGGAVTSYYGNYNISDFRVYSTTMNEADIKELYQTPISVDKSGNSFAIEYNEKISPKFHKTGIVENSYIHENEADNSDTLKTFHFDRTKTFTNQIYEI